MCVYVCVCKCVKILTTLLWLYIKTRHCVVVYSALVHTASRQTRFLHPKNLSPSVSLVRVESPLLSNKVSRRVQGGRGGFWVLKQCKEGGKRRHFLSQQPWCKETVVAWHRSGGEETVTRRKASDSILLPLSYCAEKVCWSLQWSCRTGTSPNPLPVHKGPEALSFLPPVMIKITVGRW